VIICAIFLYNFNFTSNQIWVYTLIIFSLEQVNITKVVLVNRHGEDHIPSPLPLTCCSKNKLFQLIYDHSCIPHNVADRLIHKDQKYVSFEQAETHSHNCFDA